MAHKTYVLSDLHGNYQIFLDMLEKIQFDDTDQLYILGDCNDRGNDTYEIYEYLFSHPDNIFLLKGNHEVMMKDFLVKDDWFSDEGRLWIFNGGVKTMESIEKHCLTKEERKAYIDKLIQFVDSCDNYAEITVNQKDYVLVHAGVNSKYPLCEQSLETLVWTRGEFFYTKGYDNKTILFGHTPTCLLHRSSCLDVWYDPVYHDKIGIDGGLAGFPGAQLNCICLDTQEVFVIKKQ